ncbi:molybdenum cofactor synthesis domain-containing protein [Desulfonatronum thiosulfatophilum]|uniref:Molybdenum cofactor synthesis domain-containing protein n=1 Tax=Desulfonatronum thiosulfatophilum TaxID=617002 RepID=A0A1G6DCS0_9BACT|nr:competence/damage-inducible protein A [Desulfonatronum thiosulfatophilum]SDB42921.1 molybdenum cofactor synthesis domain-containing protein [Desulfonatronum thiosulfatophilum]
MIDDTNTVRPGVAEILSIGNELLDGSIQDGNSYWLISRVMKLGGVVARVSILPDDMDVIAQEVQEALNRTVGKAPDVLFVSGGLGPTMDDLTLGAVAKGLGLPLEMHAKAREMVRQGFDALAARGSVEQGGLNPAREKMAMLPRGAIALRNPAGTAPGVLVEREGRSVVCFPGVPGELQQIFQTSLQPFLAKIFPEQAFAQHALWIGCNDESVLAPHLEWFQKRYPDIHVKARSGLFDENPKLKFVFSLGGQKKREVEDALDRALHDLTVRLEEYSYHVTSATDGSE